MFSVWNYVYVILPLTEQTKRHSKITKDEVSRLQSDDNIHFYQYKQLKTKDIAKGCGKFLCPLSS